MKYGIWNIQALEPGSVNALVGGGYAPLPAMVLASRGMKTVREAGAGTGTYGLFRDLAAPFGVAVFVPLFTNRITNLISSGVHGADDAVQSIHVLAIAELICIAAGIAAVFCLPRIHSKVAKNETQE